MQLPQTSCYQAIINVWYTVANYDHDAENFFNEFLVTVQMHVSQ